MNHADEPTVSFKIACDQAKASQNLISHDEKHILRRFDGNI